MRILAIIAVDPQDQEKTVRNINIILKKFKMNIVVTGVLIQC